tara:strand:+ start:4761 stop:5003 length:243 start_codon:yes stop_codon:yes gene_type:complete
MIPDGLRKKFENPQIADEAMSEFTAENQLNSYTYKSGKTIAFASRIIDRSGKMGVIQRIDGSNGKSHDNLQYYLKGNTAT